MPLAVKLLEPTVELADALVPYLAAPREAAGRCWVLANMVAGLDGSAAIGGRVGALSTGADAEMFRAMRTLADVVLVGAQTVRSEGYGPVRLPPDRQQERLARGRKSVPPLAIVSASLRLDPTSPAFTDAAVRTMVLTCAAAPQEELERLRDVAEVIVAGDERVELLRALSVMAERGHRIVLCEGGPTLLGELVAADLLDELCLTIAPLMGGDPLPVAIAPPGAPVRSFHLEHVLAEEDTLFLRYTRGAT
jgi:riboflavin biosynthesis pyrimidine reductase